MKMKIPAVTKLLHKSYLVCSVEFRITKLAICVMVAFMKSLYDIDGKVISIDLYI